MAEDWKTRVRLCQADHGLALCGCEVDGLGPMAAKHVLEVTCAAELCRLIGQFVGPGPPGVSRTFEGGR